VKSRCDEALESFDAGGVSAIDARICGSDDVCSLTSWVKSTGAPDANHARLFRVVEHVKGGGVVVSRGVLVPPASSIFLKDIYGAGRK